MKFSQFILLSHFSLALCLQAQVAASSTPARSNSAITQSNRSANITLRNNFLLIDKEMAKLKSPSAALRGTVKSRKSNIERNFKRLEEQVTKLGELQTEFNQSNKGSYSFKQESTEERNLYITNGLTAYKAMMVDLEGRSEVARIRGLNQFEKFAENYQGLPEYKKAFEIYSETILKLEKIWGTAIKAEERKMKYFNEARIERSKAMAKAQHNKFKEKCKKENIDIETEWFSPHRRNLITLELANRRVIRAAQAIRSSEEQEDGREIKRTDAEDVPVLLTKFWTKLDKIRQLMVAGELVEAQNQLSDSDDSLGVLRLNRRIFASEYRTPLQKEHRDLENEIRNRLRSRQAIERKLENAINKLDRSIAQIQTQIDAVCEEIVVAQSIEAEDELRKKELEKEEAEEKALQAIKDKEDEDAEEKEDAEDEEN